MSVKNAWRGPNLGTLTDTGWIWKARIELLQASCEVLGVGKHIWDFLIYTRVNLVIVRAFPFLLQSPSDFRELSAIRFGAATVVAPHLCMCAFTGPGRETVVQRPT